MVYRGAVRRASAIRRQHPTGGARMTLDTTSESKPSSASESPTPVAPVSKKNNKLEINKYFEALVKLDGSDLHLKVDQPPYMRVKG